VEAVVSSETTLLLYLTKAWHPRRQVILNFDTDLKVCMAVIVEFVSFSLMVVCCLLWLLLFHRNMLVAVKVRLWSGNIGVWEVLNFMCRN